MSKKTDSPLKQTDKEPLPETIANLKKALEALRESEDRYRDLVENSQDLICTHDLEGRILSLNPWASKVLGYDMDTILQMNIRDLLAAEVREGFDAYLAKIRKRGAATGLLIVQTAAGERRIWEYNNTLRTEGVAVPVVRGMARDITERKRAEEANRLHIHFLESLEQIDKAIRQETDVELMLKNVLDRVSFIFDCDRAWLFYPCDPDAPTFRVPFEISKPEYPGANALNTGACQKPKACQFSGRSPSTFGLERKIVELLKCSPVFRYQAYRTRGLRMPTHSSDPLPR
ncbi:MAG: PAS domain S-box protein [Chloroflexi bacterium]|nr:PAS domain S-box protein [Chloroflexota bacterium]